MKQVNIPKHLHIRTYVRMYVRTIQNTWECSTYIDTGVKGTGYQCAYCTRYIIHVHVYTDTPSS